MRNKKINLIWTLINAILFGFLAVMFSIHRFNLTVSVLGVIFFLSVMFQLILKYKLQK